MSEYIQVTTTTPSRDDADRIADMLVERRLAACVQIIDTIDSTYRWGGKVEKMTEWLCLVKTEERLYAQVEAAIKEAHPYDVPEILAFHVVGGSADYLSWLRGEVLAGGSSEDAGKHVP